MLPRQWYRDSQIFHREWREVFETHWLCVGRADRLQQTGSFLTLELGEAPLLIVRAADDLLRGFHNVCRHRGALLVARTQGRLAKSCLTCPYHAWTYDLQGRLIGAPNMIGVEDFDANRYGLMPVGCVQWEGFVWVNLAGGAQREFEQRFAPLVERVAPWRLGELQAAATLQYEVAANWKIVFQNYSECYHCPTVHPQLNRLTPYDASENDLTEGPFLGGPMTLAKGQQTLSETGQAVAPPLPGLDAQRRRRVYYYTLFPTMFVSLHPDYVLTHRLMPLDVGRTRVECEFLFHPSALADDAFDPSPAVRFWDVTNRQDWNVCERTQRGVASPAYRPGPYARLESMVAAFDRHYRSLLLRDP